MATLLDTSALVVLLRRRPPAGREVVAATAEGHLRAGRGVLSSVTVTELLVGARDRAAEGRVLELLGRLPVVGFPCSPPTGTSPGGPRWQREPRQGSRGTGSSWTPDPWCLETEAISVRLRLLCNRAVKYHRHERALTREQYHAIFQSGFWFYVR